MKPIASIDDFGRIEAESDDLLVHSFQHHPAIDRVTHHRRILILGRKGSGKTALYRNFEQPSPHNFFSGYSFVDYPWDHHDRQVTPDAVDQERYLHSWKYLILVTIAKLLVSKDQSLPGDNTKRESIGHLRDFLKDAYGSIEPSLSDIFRPTRRVSMLDRLSIDVKLLKIDSNAGTIQNLPHFVQDLNRKLLDLVLQSTNPDHNYYIAFDELDRGFDPGDSRYTQRLVGLLLAARDITRASTTAGSNIRPLVFLRSDIYHQHLDFEDKNKLTDTYSVEIEWEIDNSPTLKKLMELRFQNRLEDESVEWEDLFDESKEMTGRQSKYSHIIARTLHRPRDVIGFCNHILDQFKHRISADPSDDQHQFTNEDINNARKKYSRHFRRELEDENFKAFPDFKVWLRALGDVEAQEFSRVEFEKSIGARKDKLKASGDIQYILEKLFELSVIGFRRIGGRGGGSKYVFKYIEPENDLSIHSNEFKLHPGILDDLGVKRWSRS